MPIINRIADFQAEMAAWRQDLHRHPETAFEEHRTAELVAQRLESFGIAIELGVARTGVIGTLQGARPGGRSHCAARRYGRAADRREELFRACLDASWPHARLRP